MGFKASSFYQDVVPRRATWQSPVKLQHVSLPLAFLLLSLYRNQNIALLSVAEAWAGIGIAVLSFLPLFVWASRTEREPPAFQCFCAVHFPFYAYPILSCKPAYMNFPESVRLTADAAVLIYLSVAMLIYHVGRNTANRTGPASFLAHRQLPERTVSRLFTVVLVGWCAFSIAKNFGMLRFLGPFGNTVNSAANGGGIVALWLLSRQIGERKLSPPHTLFVLAVILTGLTIMFATASLIGGFIMLIIGVVGYTLSQRTVPWALILACLFVMAFLNLGKGEVRRIFWGRAGVQQFFSVSKIIAIYETWIPASWEMLMNGEQRNRDSKNLFDRANLIHVMALVIDQSPDKQPFMWGETYKYIPICLVPRFLWYDKPHGHIATEILGIHYGLTDAKAIRKTTVGIGMLAEAWANFGWYGVVGLSIFVGASMRAVSIGCYGAARYSIHTLLSVVWVAWSFQIELPLSVWFSSLAQSAVVVIVLSYLFSRSAMPSLDRLRSRSTAALPQYQAS